MAQNSFDDETLAWVREMPLSLVLDKLRDAGKLFWRRDPTSSRRRTPGRCGFMCRRRGRGLGVAGDRAKWFDTRAGKGGGGGIDLVMHLLGSISSRPSSCLPRWVRLASVSRCATG
jgi:hypothetical protein